MSEFQLIEDVHATVTPAGAYFAVSGPAPEPARNVLLGMLRSAAMPVLSAASIRAWSGLVTDDEALALLHMMQTQQWITANPQPTAVPGLRIESEAPALLAQLSDEGRALLADGDGLLLASIGFAPEAAERVAALGAEIGNVHARFKDLLRGGLGLRAGGLGIIDAAGNSQLGFWPMLIGAETFVLVIAGAPLLNNPAYAQLVRGLAARYAAPA